MWKKIKTFAGANMKRLHKDVRGMEALEYLLIAAMVVIASVAAYKYLGQSIQNSAVAIGDATIKGVNEGIKAGLGSEGPEAKTPTMKPNNGG